ncbi:MAG: hypothetical protein GF364_12600 [Candidatus Lokiarchaeota archaeon]|nr:hypothetical protein [Candidatus Lokiarchaeota archaeon]
MNNSSRLLSDLGEFDLLYKVLLPTIDSSEYVSPLGDDCAYVSLPSGQNDLVLSTDVAPQPLVWHLGHTSYRTWGWYSVVVAVSDLASASASPLVFTTSIDAPKDMLVDELKEFFEGIAEASRVHNISNAGGNIREASKFACHTTVIGLSAKEKYLRRVGAVAGDYFFSVGNCGKFCSVFLKAKQEGFCNLSSDEQNVLCRPYARINEMKLLFENNLFNAASDNSDGVLGSLWNIADASKCSIVLDMSDKLLPDYVKKAALDYDYDPWNLFYFWGDWQVIVSVPTAKLDSFTNLTKNNNIPIYFLGRADKGPPELIGHSGERTGNVKLLRNENFQKSSFNQNVLEHVESMLRTPIWC